MTEKSGLHKLQTPIAVIGLGKSGLSALTLLKASGFSENDLLTFDEKNPIAKFSTVQSLLEQNPKTLVVSPGVPLQSQWIRSLVDRGVQLTSEISLAAGFITTEKIIGVTGSVGKSTVVSLLGAGTRAVDPNSFVGGNLGIPFCDYVLSLKDGKPKADWIVLELSSYQLENCENLKLDFSAITFLSENHLERYKSVDEYYLTKMKITEITKNACVFNGSSADAVRYSVQSKCKTETVTAENLSAEEKNRISLIGSHNHDNFAVAQRLAKLAGWGEKSLEQMYRFSGLHHRLEKVGEFSGVQFINDSKATAMDSVLVATHGCLESLPSEKSLFLLLGGKDKNLPWENLTVLKQYRQIHFIFFGACGELAKSKSGHAGPVFKTLNDAIEYCFQKTHAGDKVLLSPGGTSLDEFKNFEERGNFFKNKVKDFYK